MKIAFVFPGQGSQSVGMMKSFAGLPGMRDTFAEASSAIGQDLWQLVEAGPAEELNLTVNTQPVMLAAGVALHRAWNASTEVRPMISAGHSLGEYSALVAGGAIDFADAVALVRFRAQAMQEAVPAGVGAMAAILGLEDEVVRTVCKEASGSKEIVEAAKGKGAKRAIRLPMSVPSHCSLMRPAAELMRERLKIVKIGTSSLSVLHNADVKNADSAEAVRDALVRQLYQPVRWVDTIRAIVSAGATHIIECGPGRVLAGLNKRIAPETRTLSFGDELAFKEALVVLK